MKKIITLIGIENIQDNNILMKKFLLTFSLILINTLYIYNVYSIQYIYILLILICFFFSIFKRNKNLLYCVIILIFFYLNFVLTYWINQKNNEYQRNILIESRIDTDIQSCLIDGFNNNPSLGFPRMYQYHTPKSNLFLPTLGIRYKENYKEERGIVVIYEKRSYLNLYVGEGRVLCKSEGDLETLE